MDARSISLVVVSLALLGMSGWAFSLNSEVSRLEQRLERVEDGRGGKAGKRKRGKAMRGERVERDAEPDAREGRPSKAESRKGDRVDAARELGRRVEDAKTDTGLSEAKREALAEALREEKRAERHEAQRARLAEREAAVEDAARAFAEAEGLSEAEEEGLMTLIEDTHADGAALIQQAEDGAITTGALRSEMQALRAERDKQISALLGKKQAEGLLSDLEAIEPQPRGGGVR